MTALTFSAPTPDFGLGQLFRDEPLFTAAGLCLLALVVPTLAAFALEVRTLGGVNPWIKPLKFELSLAAYLLTLAFFARFLPEGMTAARGYRIFSFIVVVAIALELIWIGNAAMRVIPSHFATDAFYGAIYGLMGLLAVILTSASLVYGLIILWHSPDALRLGIAISLILTFVLTLCAAGYMANQTGHFVGTPSSGNTLWLMGWSREVGDLRVAHFFATHAMHFLPVAALAIAYFIPEGGQRITILVVSVAYAGFTVWTLAEAIAGRPFI